MSARDKLSFPPTRSDLVMYVGLATMVYTGIEKAWGAFILGGVVLIAGLFAPRMKGPFSFGGPKLNFKGELASSGDDELMPAVDAQPGRLLPPEPPEESQPPLGRPR